MVQLQRAKKRFREHGLGLAAISYDNEGIMKEFSERFKIEYSLLADPDLKIIRSFNLLDPDNGPNNRPDFAKQDFAYPGFFYVDPKGIIKEKFFGVQYFDRYTANNVVAKLFPELLETAGRPVKTPHLQLALKQSDVEVNQGNRVTLGIDITLPKGMHIYAPDVKGYQPIQLVFEPEGARPKASHYPRAEVLLLPAIKEKVPVYKGRFGIRQDVLIAPPRNLMQELMALGGGGDRSKNLPMTVRAKLKYQACDDRVCYPPIEVPLSWEFRVHVPDQIRVSEKVQDHPK